ncbi:MAG: S41 family peptidase [Prevotellaceae bacterium]|jgi:carboxyl-terminal processing protease|nr:S41 family peptidase [Prevotellaceae bacterium]
MNTPQTPQRKPFLQWILFLLFLLVGIYIGQRTTTPTRTFSLDVANELSKLELVLQQVQDNYLDTVHIPTLIENSLPLIMTELDPHSQYISAEDMARANESIEGNFDGIGVTFNMPSDTVVVMNVIAGGPSERAGIRPGDRILTVNDSLIAGRKLEQNAVVKMLRGQRGTKVRLGVARSGEKTLLPVTIIRDKIPVKSVDAAYMINHETAYIHLSKFSKTTYQEFLDAMSTMRTAGMKNLILDLRGNTGGLLEQSFEIANEFLEKENMIVYTKGRARPRQDYKATGNGRYRDVRLAILIDENSASASEIVAGAIQDNDRGLIIGRRSFGKGLVQEPIFFSDNSGLRLSVARYYTPTGRSIQKPYESNNLQAYENELNDRYRSGEMNTSDSAKMSGEQFLTPKGKILYGGGGIMPDVFVPIDTTGFNPYFISINRKNLIYRFALQFTDQRRAALNAIRTPNELNNYFAGYHLDELFRRYAAGIGVIATDTEWEECRHLIDVHLRAYIGRNTPLEDLAYYMTIAKIDHTLSKAIEELNEPSTRQSID